MQVSPGSQVMLDNVERYGLYLARSLNDTNSTKVLSRQNIGTVCHQMYRMKVAMVDISGVSSAFQKVLATPMLVLNTKLSTNSQSSLLNINLNWYMN